MIRQIQVRNFKSMQDAVVPLGSLTIVVGANATGKSNLLEAMRLVRGLAAGMTTTEAVFGRIHHSGEREWRGIRGGMGEFYFDALKPIMFSLGCEAAASKFLYSIAFQPRQADGVPRLWSDTLAASSGSSFFSTRLPDDHEGADTALAVAVDFSWPPKFDDAPHSPLKTKNYDATRATLVQIPRRIKEDEALRDACTTVIDALTAMRFLDLDPDTMRAPSPPGATRLGDRGENLSSVLQAIVSDASRKAALLEWIRALTPMDATDIEIVVDVTGRVVAYLVESSGRKISFYSASDGTLRFLGIAAALLGPDPGRLYFIEELDTGIHPTRLHLLLELIEQACEHDGIQVVATTHNPALLTYLSPQARKDALLTYRREGAQDTRVRRISDLPHFDKVLEHNTFGELHASGWLENVAAFADADAETEGPSLVAEPGLGEE
jgi:predicted ATPase